jgi:hypothetical protein
VSTTDDFGLAELDFSAVTPTEFRRIVKETPAREAAEFMAGPYRRRVLDELFSRMERLYKPAAAPDEEAVIRWRICAPDDTWDIYEAHIGGGHCTVTPHATARTPTLVLTLGGTELLKVASGNASPASLFLTGRVKAQGDFRLARSLTHIFDLPTP